MRSFITSATIAIVALCSTAISTSAAERIKRDSRTESLEHFNKISVGEGIIVNYTPFGSDTYATVSAPDGVLENIELTQVGDCLKVDYAKDYAEVRHYGEAIVNVTCPGLVTNYEAHSAGTIDVRSAINSPLADITVEASTDGLISFRDVQCNKLNIECRSGSKVIADEIACDDVVCESTATSKVELTGNCHTCTLIAATHSTIEASKLDAYAGSVTSGDRCMVSSHIRSVSEPTIPSSDNVAEL
ncbi:MAG: DUF2807 domain-containing protein [Paramuribaculum sp.]|nr:DUF2807 domain-containing protein [Paramuribaculum sp.]